jgi:serine/threonine protein kinase
MLDFRFLDYCREDTLFYDAPDGSDADQDFHVSRVPADGWTVDRGREWTVCTAANLQVPDQGWKIHVSASPDNAEDLLDIVAPYCTEHELMFKYISSRDILSRRGSKYGDRTASGKFITIYPPDVESLECTLRELDDLIGGTPAPYILSDLRWRKGPLFVRYGGFVLKMARAEHGALVPAIENPDGELVPDVRRPSFRPPAWVSIPEFLAEAHALRSQGTLKDFPFRVYKALHFSNGGGVYRAVDTRTGDEVLLKEARPLAGLDSSGADAVSRMEREHWAVTRLAGLPFVPAFVDYRNGHEHRFLAREFIEGEPLVDLLQTRHPYTSGDNTPAGRSAHRTWALGILDQVEQGVHAMHKRGVVFGDLHPGNILVKPDGTVAFIDMETATPVEDNCKQSMGALGFHAPGHLLGAAADLYALSVLRLSLFVPMTQIIPWGAAKVRELIEVAATQFELPPTFVADIEHSLGPDALGNTTDYTVPWPAEPVDSDLRSRIAASIIESATPQRRDRLYPGDALQFLIPGGGTTFGYGAAGVLWALSRTGHQPPADHQQWLVDRAEDFQVDGPGFYTGLAGVAYTLEHLGHSDAATAVLDRALAMPLTGVSDSLAEGSSGLGLTALYLADLRRDPAYLSVARELAARLGQDGNAGTGATPRVGLLYGRTGPALLLLRLFQQTGDSGYLDAAIDELRADLSILGLHGASTGRQLGPGLAGSAGLAMVTRAILRERTDEHLQQARNSLLSMAYSQYAVPGGLFKGRSGAVLALVDHDQPTNTAILHSHVEALGWEAVSPAPGRIDFIGDHGHRLSTDLATGSAGVLIALEAVACRAPLLPFIGTDQQAVLT